MDNSEFKAKFNAEIQKQYESKYMNQRMLPKEKYLNIIEKLKLAKEKCHSPSDFLIVKKFDIAVVNKQEKLFCKIKSTKQKKIFYAHMDELFDILQAAHLAVGQLSRNKMLSHLTSKYKNISREVVETYRKLCHQYGVTKLPKEAVPPKEQQKAMTFKKFNERCQIDFIDFQAYPDGDYQFILNYQDHFTKYCLLRPLKTKTAFEVSTKILHIFSDFGAPKVLQINNDKEYSNYIINEFPKMFPGLEIVLENSQSLASVKKANKGVEKMISTWRQTNPNYGWSTSLVYVQMMMNGVLHSEIRKSPYESLFGFKMYDYNGRPNQYLHSSTINPQFQATDITGFTYVCTSGTPTTEIAQVFNQVYSTDPQTTEIVYSTDNRKRVTESFEQQGTTKIFKHSITNNDNNFASTEENVIYQIPDGDRGSEDLMSVVMSVADNFYSDNNNANETFQQQQQPQPQQLSTPDINDYADFKLKFDAKVKEIYEKKHQNQRMMTQEKYVQLIEYIKQAKEKCRTPFDYQRIKKYDLVTVDNQEKVICPVKSSDQKTIFYAHMDELFEILKTAHLITGHGGRSRMTFHTNSRYKNISREVIEIYLKLCQQCQQKGKKANKKKD